MSIGLPGSGKTTALESFAQRYGYRYISNDNVRADFNIRRGEHSIPAVWDEIRRRIKEGADNDETIVMDSTFVTGPDRREFIKFIRECGVQKIQGVFFDTPSELAWERNSKPDMHMQKEIFDSRAKDLESEPPAIQDGFDSLFTLNEFQKMMLAETAEQRKEFGHFS